MRIAAPLNTEFEPALQWVEVACFFQIPSFQIIGLPSPEVAEARERIRAAIEASQLEFPRRRVVLNLSPASIRKRGTGLDLAMALAVLASTRPSESEKIVAAWGELGLDGTVKPAGQITRVVYAAWKKADYLLVPAAEASAARQALKSIWDAYPGEDSGPIVISVRSLAEANRWLEAPESLDDPAMPGMARSCLAPRGGDGTMEENEAKTPTPQLLPLPSSLERVLGIAAAGRHHLLLLGPRGTGKTYALEWLTAIQAPADPRILIQNRLMIELRSPDFRGHSPEPLPGASGPIVRRVGSQSRPAALLGSVHPGFTRPGEFSLSHGGLLVADELPEWPRDTRELLREPLEDGRILLTRARCSAEFPARFTLAATGNLCPCGGWPPEIPIPLSFTEREEASRPPRCKCRQAESRDYIARLSGPVLDRLDLVTLVTVPSNPSGRKPSDALSVGRLRERVAGAHELSIGLWGKPPGWLSGQELEDILKENGGWKEHLDGCATLSLRSRHKTLRVALTLAAWEGAEMPGKAQFFEASCYRPERFGFCD